MENWLTLHQEFDFDGATVIYDIDAPLEYDMTCGNTKIHVKMPHLTYEERRKRYEAIRDELAKIHIELGYNLPPANFQEEEIEVR